MRQAGGTPLVAIIGAGFAGMGVAIELKRNGIDDFVILERGDDVGGVWRENNYPGCRCDIPSALYSYSFAKKPDWEDHYATQPEIWRYLQDVAEKFEIAGHIRFHSDVQECRWNPQTNEWDIETSRGPLRARLLVNATGSLNEPVFPDIAGIDSFAGTSFHSSQWPLDFQVAKRRIAIVGTGASAVQLVPEIAAEADEVVVFQRTAPWVVPRNDHKVDTWHKELRRRLPFADQVERSMHFAQRELYNSWFAKSSRAMSLVERVAARHLESQVADPQLRQQLQPNFRVGCKRILLSDDWYPTLQRDNVSVVTDPMTGIAAGGIQTKSADGSIALHQVDTIVFATGFAVTRLPFVFKVFGEKGRSLARTWGRTGSSAYLGTTVHGFPNLAIMTGPNTGLAANSMVVMIEAQAKYVRQMAAVLRHSPDTALEVKEEAQAAYQTEIDERLTNSVWTADGCTSWYQGSDGKVSALWPGTTTEFKRRTRRFRQDDYELV